MRSRAARRAQSRGTPRPRPRGTSARTAPAAPRASRTRRPRARVARARPRRVALARPGDRPPRTRSGGRTAATPRPPRPRRPDRTRAARRARPALAGARYRSRACGRREGRAARRILGRQDLSGPRAPIPRAPRRGQRAERAIRASLRVVAPRPTHSAHSARRRAVSASTPPGRRPPRLGGSRSHRSPDEDRPWPLLVAQLRLLAPQRNVGDARRRLELFVPVCRGPGDLAVSERGRDSSPPVCRENSRESVLEPARVFAEILKGRITDDGTILDRDEADRTRKLLFDPLVERTRLRVSRGHHVRHGRDGDGIRAGTMLLLQLDDSASNHAVAGNELPSQLDVAPDLGEAARLREPERGLVTASDNAPHRICPEHASGFPPRFDQLGADPAPARGGQHPHHGVRASADARIVDERIATAGMQQETVLHRSHLLDRQRNPFDLSEDANAELDIGVGLRGADHPDRLSLPCRFACSSPRRKTQMPSGIEMNPMISIGHRSPQTWLTVAPSRIAERSPRNAYVAGEIVAIHCMNCGRTETG